MQKLLLLFISISLLATGCSIWGGGNTVFICGRLWQWQTYDGFVYEGIFDKASYDEEKLSFKDGKAGGIVWRAGSGSSCTQSGGAPVNAVLKGNLNCETGVGRAQLLDQTNGRSYSIAGDAGCTIQDEAVKSLPKLKLR